MPVLSSPPPELEPAIGKLLSRLERVGVVANIHPLQELNSVGAKPGVPEWLISILTQQPLAGIQVGVRTPEFEAAGLGPKMFEWGSSELILELNRDSYPGMHVYPYGYLAVGYGVEWAGNVGNVLLLDLNTDSVSVFELWHDVSQDPSELVAALRELDNRVLLLADSLADFLNTCEVEPPTPRLKRAP